MYTEPRETTQDGESHKSEASNDSIFRHLVSLPELFTHNNYYGMGASGWRGGVRVPRRKRTVNPKDPFLVINGNSSKPVTPWINHPMGPTGWGY